MKYVSFLILLVGVIFICICITGCSSNNVIFETPSTLPAATVGEYYNYSFCRPPSSISGATCGGLAGETSSPIGGNPPYTFSHQFNTGFIPTGMSIELNGLLRGKPMLPGNYTFGICANDGTNEACTRVLLKVKDKPAIVPPAITVTHASATVTSVEHPSGGDVTHCTVKLSGTAAGPECTDVRIIAEHASAGTSIEGINCTDWQVHTFRGFCLRQSLIKDNDLPTISWEITINASTYWGKHVLEYTAILDVPVQSGDEPYWTETGGCVESAMELDQMTVPITLACG